LLLLSRAKALIVNTKKHPLRRGAAISYAALDKSLRLFILTKFIELIVPY
jgi:hypothetical protein